MTTTLKTINSSTLRDNLSDTLDALEETTHQVLLVQRHGETNAALISIDLLESVLDSLDKSLVSKLKQAQKQADSGQTVSFIEAFGKL